MQPLPISLPFDYPEGASARVFVFPDKTYSNLKGSELFELYGFTPRQPRKPKLLSSYQFNITESYMSHVEEVLACATPISFCVHLVRGFPDTMRISGYDYDVRAICRIIETITGIKLFSLRENRPLRSAMNISIEVKGYSTDDSLLILGRRDKVYLLNPSRRNWNE